MENTNVITNDGMLTENGGMPQEKAPKEKNQIASRQRKRLIFYICMLIFPLLNFSVFYVYVNLDMFKLAFMHYELDPSGVGYLGTFVWFENFEYVVNFISTRMHMVTMSMSFYFYTLVCMPIAVIFSYYIYKGYPAANFFRVVLYLPSIFSGVVMVMLYQYLFRYVFRTELLLGHILFYNVWASFGMNIIMYTGAMCGINTSIPESASLDGATAIQEFWYITIPMIFPTIRTFLVMGIVHLFTNSANLYTFYGNSSPLRPLGYWMTVEKLDGSLVSRAIDPENHMNYPQLSALGVIITVATLPVTLIIRRLLEKYGPSED
ncbi:MAG: sugar ABC transporter permease [Clostridiales bacterium]|nr:sugar ABC transporter permease [Clostridiales bacterium]